MVFLVYQAKECSAQSSFSEVPLLFELWWGLMFGEWLSILLIRCFYTIYINLFSTILHLWYWEFALGCSFCSSAAQTEFWQFLDCLQKGWIFRERDIWIYITLRVFTHIIFTIYWLNVTGCKTTIIRSVWLSLKALLLRSELCQQIYCNFQVWSKI